MLKVGCAGTETPVDDPKCQINTPSEKTPGYPYDLAKFQAEIVPVLVTNCSGAGCHSPPNPQGAFLVLPTAAEGNSCDINQTFNSVVSKVDLVAPNNSRLTAAVDGGSLSHPKKFVLTNATDKAALDKLRAFITDAKTRQDADGGGGETPGPGPSPFDYTVFQQQIQPAVTAAGCAVSGCHLTGAGGFTLVANPAPNSDDMVKNFKAITSRTLLSDPDGSTVYIRATTPHNGGTSTQVAAAGAAALLDWITKARDANGNQGGDAPPGCAPASSFNLGVFTSEILPIITGEVDLNQPGQGRGAGCTSVACHGTNRGPGALSMLPGDPAQVLANFACFVNLTSPSQSEIVLCPLGQFGCRKNPHPGQNVFRDGADLNYQRFLAFIYGAKAASSPHDFAFFARKINPIFDDPASVQGGQQGLTCASAAGCHGVSVAGQSPPNGSDFPMLSNASDTSSLTFNFVSAAGFVSFLNARDSSLFLYPTNEIVNKTGANHPGGPDFAIDSQQALDILTWATGLRPDGNGFANNWLVLGDFAANLITDPILSNERTIAPRLFDADGGQFNNGRWEGLFSPNQNIDLNSLLPGVAGQSRAAYAVAYLLNTDAFQRDVQLIINSPNALRVFVDGNLKVQADRGGTSQVFMTLAGSGSQTEKPVARIMLKVLQGAQDAQFAFTAQLTDENGLPLTNLNSGLVFTLAPDGGI